MMKSSLKKLRKIAALGNDRRSQKQRSALAKDELAQATLNMNELKDCYEKLLSAAAAMANSVYEFSESLREMGDCLLEKTALNDDEESGLVLLMLGKVQFELQKLVDGYRSHISQTITVPSESLLNELHVVEVMKNRCDDKRKIFEELKKKHKDKRRSSNTKDECLYSPQLQEAQDEYEEETNAFVFRVKSLKQGQSRSFLTQASRHHAAQLSLFRRAVRSLETIEPHVTLLAKQYHIDYQFIKLKDSGDEIYNDSDDGTCDEDCDTEDGSGTSDSGTLSFNYVRNHQSQDAPESRNSMEVDSNDLSCSPEPAKEVSRSPIQDSISIRREMAALSKSAPLFPAKKLHSAERGPQPRPLPFVSYVLPTPDETRSPHVSGKLSNEVPKTRKDVQTSSVAEANKNDKPGSVILTTQSTRKASPLPPPLTEDAASYAKKAKIQAFSGPLTGKPWPSSQYLSNSNRSTNSSPFPPFSGSLLRTPLSRPPPSTSKLPSRVSPSFVSSPKISELHELPRPPATRGPPHLSGHSGPLISTSRDPSTASATRVTASPVLTRSYSIPGGGQVQVAALQPLPECSRQNTAQNVSPPATPITLQRIQPASPPS